MAHRTAHGITFFDFETISEAQAALNDDGVDLEEHEYWTREIQREQEEEMESLLDAEARDLGWPPFDGSM